MLGATCLGCLTKVILTYHEGRSILDNGSKSTYVQSTNQLLSNTNYLETLEKEGLVVIKSKLLQF